MESEKVADIFVVTDPDRHDEQCDSRPIASRSASLTENLRNIRSVRSRKTGSSGMDGLDVLLDKKTKSLALKVYNTTQAILEEITESDGVKANIFATDSRFVSPGTSRKTSGQMEHVTPLDFQDLFSRGKTASSMATFRTENKWQSAVPSLSPIKQTSAAQFQKYEKMEMLSPVTPQAEVCEKLRVTPPYYLILILKYSGSSIIVSERRDSKNAL